jgi:hypothetical protein
MLRLLVWVLVILTAALVVNGTLPLPGIAMDEVVYATPPPVPACGSQGCIGVYTLEVANVGRSPQEMVRVRLREEPIGTPVVAPTVRRTADTTLALPVTDRAGSLLYPVGPLAPEERATLVFALRAPSREAMPGWERLLIGIDTTRGGARLGDPSAMSAGRLVHALGRVVDRVVRAIAAS